MLSWDHRALLELRGPDAADLLHRISSQDTLGLSVGAAAPGCLLTGKGKLLAAFWILRPEPERFVLEVDRPRLDEVRQLVDRFVFAEQVELVARPELRALAVVGPEATTRSGQALAAGTVAGTGDLLWVRSDELGVPCLRLWGDAAAVDAEAARLVDAGLPAGGFTAFEVLRVMAGMPRQGLDADEATIPLEVNLDDWCRVDKGCYTGQEVIARIHTYGHVNRRLARLRLALDALPAPGTGLYEGGLEAGRLTSAVRDPASGAVLALGMLPLAVLEDDEVELHLGGAEGPRVELLR
ncbi:MAG: hypothetical protein R3F30_05040 [Planctomycetota bacterium]